MQRLTEPDGTRRSLLRRVTRRLAVAAYGPKRVRVVVLGHQKSGTTAVGALLARGLAADFGNDPLYCMDWGQGAAAQSLLDGKIDLRSMVHAKPTLFCSTVLKDPDLTFQITQCTRVFPKARFVFVVRDPRDNVRSIADRLRLSASDLSRPSVQGANANRHWRLILEGKLPLVEGSSVVERLAKRWKLAWSGYLENRELLTVIRYEDFIVDKARVIYDIITRLRLSVVQSVDGYVDIQYQPAGRHVVDISDRIGERNLQIIEQCCADEMVSLGYARQDRES